MLQAGKNPREAVDRLFFEQGTYTPLEFAAGRRPVDLSCPCREKNTIEQCQQLIPAR